MIKVLSKEGFHVLATDQIGFGKSTKPVNYQFSFQQMSLNIKSILDSLNINKIILLLHFMCKMLVIGFASSNPEITDKLILEMEKTKKPTRNAPQKNSIHNPLLNPVSNFTTTP
ncbi:alpha/beta fold hydrolase [Flavobacterium sp. DSR2-3-3]|uniref:alpha/beta fold hydrolase n=1 Tax=Flavobacterium sp. DSR2-3-3 TaxID=2804632 RepID=UPI003CEFCC1E